MANKLLAAGCTCLILSFACSSSQTIEYSPEISEALIHKIEAGDNLTNKDYALMMAQLEGMLELTHQKASAIVDSGYPTDRVRHRLALDSEFCTIAAEVAILDSAILSHMTKPSADPKLANRYKTVLHRYTAKARTTGLDKAK